MKGLQPDARYTGESGGKFNELQPIQDTQERLVGK